MAVADFEAVRSLAAAGISGTYATVGSPTTHKVRLILVSNATQGDLMVTWNNAKDMFPVLAGSSVLIDIQSNMNAQFDDNYVLPIGTQFYVKQITAPVDKSVYIACLH